MPHTGSPNHSGGHHNQNPYGANPTSNMLPAVVSDDNTYRLYDLVNSDFKMPVTDKDFELTHE